MTAIHAARDPDPETAPRGTAAPVENEGTRPTEPDPVSAPSLNGTLDPLAAHPSETGDGGDPFRSLTTAMRSMIDRVADRVVPALASTALVAFFPAGDREVTPAHRQRLPGHYLIRIATDPARTATVTPVLSRAIDTYAPFRRVAAGHGQLWRLDDALAELLPPGTPAIGVPVLTSGTVWAALVLFRPAGEPAFDLDDVLTLEDLVAGTTLPGGADAATAIWQPPVLTRSRHVFALRDLLRDLLTAGNPYEVARRLARAAQSFFEAEGCVVYFVDPAVPPVPAVATGAIPIPLRRRLHLAASVGPGIHLTPPWLLPEPAAGRETLFAMSADGPVLVATFDPDAVWTEPVRAGNDWLSAVPLRHDGALVALLGLRCGDGLATMSLITVENLAFIAAIALQHALRRSMEQTSALVVQSDLARSRLAHDATVAMIGATDTVAGLSAHAAALVPSVADGYVLYVDVTRLPVPTGPDPLASLRLRGTSFRVFSQWRSHQDPAAIIAFEQVIDQRVRPLLTTASPGDPTRESDTDLGDRLPLLVSDLSPVHPSEIPADHFGREAGIRSLAAVPLVQDDVTIGALVLVTTDQGRRYGSRDFSYISSLAGPVARGLTTLLRIVAAPATPTQERPAQWVGDAGGSDLPAEVAVQLIAAEDRSEVCRIVARALAEGVAAWCVIEMAAEDGLPLPVTGASADPSAPWPERYWNQLAEDRCPDRGPSRVRRTGQSDLSPVASWIDSEPEDAAGGPDAARGARRWTSLSVAIRTGDGIAGVITCLRPADQPPLTLTELETVEAVVTIAGVAIAAVDRLGRLREETARLHGLSGRQGQLLGQVADAVIVVDAAGTIVFANDMAVALHGRADLSGSIADYLCRYHPATIDGSPLIGSTFPTTAALASGEAVRQAWRFTVDDQPTRTVLAHAVPLRDGRGAITGAILTLHDVTVEHERYLRRKRTLMALSDDLKAPMTSLKGWSQFLALRTRPAIDLETEARALEAIGSQTRTLQRLVDRLVAAAGTELDEPGPPAHGQVEITGLLRQLGQIRQNESLAHRVTVHSPDGSPVTGPWDPDALEHLLSGLLATAALLRPTGGRIDVHVEQRDADVVVAITVDGTGSPPDPDAIAFHDGDRAADTDLTERDGFASSLSRVRQRARQIQADFAFHRAAGGAIVLSVRLPLPRANPSAPPGDDRDDPAGLLPY